MKQHVIIRQLSFDPAHFESIQNDVLGHHLIPDKHNCIFSAAYNHLEQGVIKEGIDKLCK